MQRKLFALTLLGGATLFAAPALAHRHVYIGPAYDPGSGDSRRRMTVLHGPCPPTRLPQVCGWNEGMCVEYDKTRR